MQRLRAVRDLVDAGIHAGVLMNPIVPGITSKPALLERTVEAIADHGARFVGCNVMFLEGGTRDHFMRYLGGLSHMRNFKANESTERMAIRATEFM